MPWWLFCHQWYFEARNLAAWLQSLSSPAVEVAGTRCVGGSDWCISSCRGGRRLLKQRPSSAELRAPAPANLLRLPWGGLVVPVVCGEWQHHVMKGGCGVVGS